MPPRHRFRAGLLFAEYFDSSTRLAGVLGDGLLLRSSKEDRRIGTIGRNGVREKVKACAEQNISATQEFVRELSYAKDIQDMLRIQMEFMRSQMEAFGEQAKDLGEAYIKAASVQTRKLSP